MWIHWPFFPKTWTKGHWPLDDLWPHVCWGHMCDSTQGSLCPSPMTIHQCMWIQWSILQNTTYIHIHTYILHTTYTYYVQNEWSHSLLLNSVQARQFGTSNTLQYSRGLTLMMTTCFSSIVFCFLGAFSEPFSSSLAEFWLDSTHCFSVMQLLTLVSVCKWSLLFEHNCNKICITEREFETKVIFIQGGNTYRGVLL